MLELFSSSREGDGRTNSPPDGGERSTSFSPLSGVYFSFPPKERKKEPMKMKPPHQGILLLLRWWHWQFFPHLWPKRNDCLLSSHFFPPATTGTKWIAWSAAQCALMWWRRLESLLINFSSSSCCCCCCPGNVGDNDDDIVTFLLMALSSSKKKEEERTAGCCV